nr:putative 12-oxophytodienoate reductase 11 [Tanacetum cinerariifolium]
MTWHLHYSLAAKLNLVAFFLEERYRYLQQRHWDKNQNQGCLVVRNILIIAASGGYQATLRRQSGGVLG